MTRNAGQGARALLGDRRGIWALVTVPVALFMLLGGLIWAVCAPPLREFQATLAIPAEGAERLRTSAGKFAWKLELTAQLHGVEVLEEDYPLRVDLR